MIKAIVCVDNNWGIGKGNELLFHIKEDMRYFRGMTTGHTVCMGRKTLESLPNHSPLPDRYNIVLSKNNDYTFSNCCTVHSLEELLSIAEDLSKQNKDMFVIGGAQLYALMFPYCQEIYVTKVFAGKDADVYFENLDTNNLFTIKNKSTIIHTDDYDIEFLIYERVDSI